MFRRLLLAFAVLIWCGVVFFATFWFTFPSDTFANRIRHEVPERLGRDWSAEVGGVRPWWFGLSVRDVKLYREGTLEDGTTAPLLTAIFEDFRLRVRPFSILRRSPYVLGSMTLPEGTVDWALGARMDRQDGLRLAEARIDSDALPIGDLLAFAGEALPATVTGNVALHVALTGGEEGIRDATGTATLEGANLALGGLPVPGVTGDVPISTLAFALDVQDGKATFQQGRIVSDLVSVEVKGDVTLREPLDRSSLDIEVILSDLSPDLAMVESFLGEKGTDGSWHWYCRGVVSRLSVSSCSQRERRTSSRLPDRPSVTPSPRTTTGATTETDEERERRRQEIQERLQKRREEREAQRAGSTTPVPAAEPPPAADDEGELEEEEPIDELPEDEPIEELPEEEEPLE